MLCCKVCQIVRIVGLLVAESVTRGESLGLRVRFDVTSSTFPRKKLSVIRTTAELAGL